MSNNYFDIYKTDSDQISINRSGQKGSLILSGLNELCIDSNFNIKNLQNDIVNFALNKQSVLIGNDKFNFAFTKSGEGAKIYVYQIESGKSLDLSLGNQFYNGNSVVEDFFDLSYRTGNLNLDVGVNISRNLKVSGTGTFNAVDLNNIDNLSLSGVDASIKNANVDLTNSTINFSGNNINFENENNINLAYQFPAWTGIRRYPPLDLLSATSSNGTVVTGAINYFPFLIKKKVTNPIACVEMVQYSTFDSKIVIGIYSGHYGFENAKLITSGFINGNISNTGIYRTTLNGTFNQGPYILASMLETGAGCVFRVVNSNGFREHFGISTGSSIIHGLNSTVLTNVLAETGASVLPQNISSGATWYATAAGNLSPLTFLEY
jgi:hypothetical protein